MSNPYHAQDPADLASRDQLLSMSGLAFMEAMLGGDLPLPPISQTFGFRLTEVADGLVAFEGSPGFGTLNPMGGVHGGWYGTLLDSAMGCAVMTKVPKGSFYTTLEYKVNILRAVPMDCPVRVEGTVRHAGRSTAVAEGSLVRTDTGVLCAAGTTTCLIMATT